jgi:DNA (cytosine-5)-methyltransferase 1
MVVSPHLIRPEFGGRPQVRNRVFIAATLIPKGLPNFKADVETPSLDIVTKDWEPLSWNLEKDLPLDKLKNTTERKAVQLTAAEIKWIEAWNEFVVIIRERIGDASLPGFPIWADEWVHIDDLEIPRGTPDWKKNFLQKNSQFYTDHRVILNKWLKKWNQLSDFPPSRRKFEWQAQETKTLWETVMHFRPSGIRAKKATYVPAMVAITQTSIIGKQKRRITTREGARLQGLPEWFDFVDQADSLSYKQLGNGVNVGAVYNVMKAQVIRDLDLLGEMPALTRSVLGAPTSPDIVLANHQTFHNYKPNTESVNLNESHQLRLIK